MAACKWSLDQLGPQSTGQPILAYCISRGKAGWGAMDGCGRMGPWREEYSLWARSRAVAVVGIRVVAGGTEAGGAGSRVGLQDRLGLMRWATYVAPGLGGTGVCAGERRFRNSCCRGGGAGGGHGGCVAWVFRASGLVMCMPLGCSCMVCHAGCPGVQVDSEASPLSVMPGGRQFAGWIHAVLAGCESILSTPGCRMATALLVASGVSWTGSCAKVHWALPQAPQNRKRQHVLVGTPVACMSFGMSLPPTLSTQEMGVWGACFCTAMRS